MAKNTMLGIWHKENLNLTISNRSMEIFIKTPVNTTKMLDINIIRADPKAVENDLKKRGET